MNWAEKRASEIVDRMRGERPDLTIGRQEEIIAEALQLFADECAELAFTSALLYANNKKQAESICREIRAQFPKEER